MLSAITLHRLLEDAGIPIKGADCNGNVHYKNIATDEHKALAATIIADEAKWKDDSVPHPDAFLNKVATLGSTELYTAAQMLARFAYDPVIRKRTYANMHLSAPHKQAIEAAAVAASMPLT